MGIWLVFEVFRGLGVKSPEVCLSLLDKIPNFPNAATEAVIQPCNMQWGKVSCQMAIKLPSVQRLTYLCKSLLTRQFLCM